MKTEQEIRERQELFVNAYHFPIADDTPEAKALRSAINASVKTRRYRVYSDIIEGRDAAVSFWKEQLVILGEKYQHSYPDNGTFFRDVFTLQETINNSAYHVYFAGGRIRVGQCQKSLSIYLKWMWCQGQLLAAPPVCPIDGKILKKCRQYLIDNHVGTIEQIRDTRTAWSNLDDRDLYMRLVLITEMVALLSDEENPSVWELFAFDEPDGNA